MWASTRGEVLRSPCLRAGCLLVPLLEDPPRYSCLIIHQARLFGQSQYGTAVLAQFFFAGRPAARLAEPLSLPAFFSYCHDVSVLCRMRMSTQHGYPFAVF